MVKAEFWRDLASRFKAAPNDYGMFRMDYEKFGNRTTWKPFATVATENAFRPLAMRAGRAINPKSTDYLLTWLAALWEACPSITGASGFDEQGQVVFRGSIPNICQASADYCNVLQSQAIQGGEFSLPMLSTNAPENFLSHEARLRIHDARLYSEQVRWEAESEILLEDLDDDNLKARRLRYRANVKAAETVLAAYKKEYTDAGLTADEIRELIDEEIEAAVNSLDLNGAQKHILRLKYASNRPTPESAKPLAKEPETTPSPKTKRKPSRIPTTVTSLPAAIRMEAFISDSNLSQTEFAIAAGTTDRTLRSFRASGKIRGDIFARIAREMGLTPEQLKESVTGK